MVARPGADPRDLIAGGADLVIGRSQSFTDYAVRLPGIDVFPLFWDRVYVLLAPGGAAPGSGAPDLSSGSNLILLREDLATRGCSSEAQPAYGLSFNVSLSGSCWQSGALGSGSEAAATARPRARIVYPAGDADAGLIAERVAGLAIMKSDLLRLTLPGSHLVEAGESPRTQALGAAEWREAVGGEDSFAYVLPLRRESFDRCGLRAMLHRQAPWVELGPDDEGPHLVPLIVTRPVVAVRHGLGGLGVAGDGTLLLARAGWYDEVPWP